MVILLATAIVDHDDFCRRMKAVLTEVYNHYHRKHFSSFQTAAENRNNKDGLFSDLVHNVLDKIDLLPNASPDPNAQNQRYEGFKNVYFEIKLYFINTDKDETRHLDHGRMKVGEEEVNGIEYLASLENIPELEQYLINNGEDVTLGNFSRNIPYSSLPNNEIVAMYGNGKHAFHIYAHPIQYHDLSTSTPMEDIFIIVVDKSNNRVLLAMKTDGTYQDIQEKFEFAEDAIVKTFEDAEGNVDYSYERVINDGGVYTSAFNFSTTTWQEYSDNQQKSSIYKRKNEKTVSWCELIIKMYYSHIQELNLLMDKCAKAQEKNQSVESYSFLRLSKNSKLKKKNQKLIYADIDTKCYTFKYINFRKKLIKRATKDVDILNIIKTLTFEPDNHYSYDICATYYSKKADQPSGGGPTVYAENNCCGIVLELRGTYYAIPESIIIQLTTLKNHIDILKSSMKSLWQKAKDFIKGKTMHMSEQDKQLIDIIKDREDNKIEDATLAMFDYLENNITGVREFSSFDQADEYMREATHAQDVKASSIYEVTPEFSSNPVEQTLLGLKLKFNMKFAYVVERFLIQFKEHIVNYDECWPALHTFMNQGKD